MGRPRLDDRAGRQVLAGHEQFVVAGVVGAGSLLLFRYAGFSEDSAARTGRSR